MSQFPSASEFSRHKPVLTPASKAEHSDFSSYSSYPTAKRLDILGWIRRLIPREPLAEFAGIAVFLIMGTGVNCTVALSTSRGVASSPEGNFLSVNFGWAAGIALGEWISGGISGGHLNPAFTLAMATWRGFPWRKVPGYISAQVLGAFFGTAIVYGTYLDAINIFEGGHAIRTKATAHLFATYPLDYLTNISCFFAEFTGTMILSLIIVAAIDKNNMAPPSGLLPVVLFILVLGIGTGLGMQTSYALNPGRDLGARILLTFAGYGGEVYSYRSQYWLWCPIIAPFLGAQVGVGFYDIFLKQRDPVDSLDTGKIAQSSESESEVMQSPV